MTLPMDDATQPWFERPLRTRGYECDATRAVPLPVYLEYFEHLRWEGLLEPRFRMVDAIRAGYFFVVHEQRVEVVRRVGLGVDLLLQGWFERPGHVLVRCGHQVVRARDGALVARATVTGAYLGPDRKPARVPPELREIAQAGMRRPPAEVVPGAPGGGPSWFDPPEVLHPPSDLTLVPSHDAPPPEAFEHRLTVLPSHKDIFDHVNAATYVRFCEDTLALGGFCPGARSVRCGVKYPREARQGDPLVVRAWPVPGTERMFDCSICRAGEPDALCRARFELE
jgi:acyl-CoA thioester hydrolase